MLLYKGGGVVVAGLFVLSLEPVRMPWFDSVYADIGDEQSLSQSLSTFSGHLKQTSVSYHQNNLLNCDVFYNSSELGGCLISNIYS